ncbi:hypothetical protein CLHOM_19460 [Clostridium homopropionicum DSM 5847]|uniref:DUF4652 domain-containing protein n=1 Tax=Clostridium homopropionicum DSM 5847 TaxID=1121318 RepID=A0A0L6ZA68_9CLOT|nr:DUF4652 domain-containing protein [Clostridium homopropionicum]KOA19857.1 hypothetical protein CLHOM_19460 [Clostridium homopropionicum DSM 5847]SFF75938.1 protein of unknown function [Clostridium homopropionicum]
MRWSWRFISYKKLVSLGLSFLLISSLLSFGGCSKKDNTIKNETVNGTNINKEEDKPNETVKEEDNNNQTEEKDNVIPGKSKVQYTKQQLDKNTEPEFATKWIDSENKKFSACISGRGPDAQEEGIGKIFIKNLSSGEKWSLELIPGEEQNSPKYIQWIDDENLINIVGLGYGTIVLGGSLYKTNINTGETTVLYEAKIPKVQVLSAKISKDKSNLELQLLVYDDEEFTKNHTEKKTISLK